VPIHSFKSHIIQCCSPATIITLSLPCYFTSSGHCQLRTICAAVRLVYRKCAKMGSVAHEVLTGRMPRVAHGPVASNMMATATEDQGRKECSVMVGCGVAEYCAVCVCTHLRARTMRCIVVMWCRANNEVPAAAVRGEVRTPGPVCMPLQMTSEQSISNGVLCVVPHYLVEFTIPTIQYLIPTR